MCAKRFKLFLFVFHQNNFSNFILFCNQIHINSSWLKIICIFREKINILSILNKISLSVLSHKEIFCRNKLQKICRKTLNTYKNNKKDEKNYQSSLGFLITYLTIQFLKTNLIVLVCIWNFNLILPKNVLSDKVELVWSLTFSRTFLVCYTTK
jgi:hypothetical protein